MSTLRSLLLLATALAFTSSLFASDGPTLEQRLERLSKSLESARVEAHIPGMSIAIVKDDKVVWTRGFGFADIDDKRPADENTIYAVGSTTKAFTATLVGMLVDEGKASWDDPVTRHLPYFDLAVRSDDKNAACTLRDLLSHRHGFSRMGILAMSGQSTREEILRTAAGAEPWDDFRKTFHYTNIMYLAAGQAAAAAADSTWDKMMVKRIFKPLRMNSTRVSLTKTQKDRRLALGYKWNESLGEFEHLKMVDLGIIGPAGAVNSNVVDMAQWLRLQLGRGEVDGKRLISTKSILETWMPQIEMAPGRSYGLGWMLREHDGKKVVEHGGTIDGFSAQVGLMPEENLGFVLLTNLNVTPFREASLELVFDALLDKWPEEKVENNMPAGEVVLGDYVGTYVANFAKFRDAKFEISINDDGLMLDIAGQQKFDLQEPDADGKWIPVQTDRVAVSFDRDDQRAVIGLKMHTNGFRFQVPREGLAIEPELPSGDLEKYVGTYVREMGGKRVKIIVTQGHLTMEDKGNRLAFHTPDAEGNAPLRAREDQGATFKSDAEGNVESFVFRGSAGARLFTRLTDPSESKLPTIDELLALRKTDARIAAIEAGGGTRIRGKVWIPQAGVRGTLSIYIQGRDRYANEMDFGKFGRISAVAKGDEAWSYNSFRGLSVLKGDELTQTILGHPGAVEGDWNDYFDSIKVVGTDTVNGRPVYVVRLRKDGLPSRTYRIDSEHGDVLRMNHVSIELFGPVPVTTDYSDFREIDGIRTAMRIESSTPMSGKTVLTLEQSESGLELGDALFTLEVPEPVR